MSSLVFIVLASMITSTVSSVWSARQILLKWRQSRQEWYQVEHGERWLGSARMFYLEWFAGPYRETSPGSLVTGWWTCSCPTSESTHSVFIGVLKLLFNAKHYWIGNLKQSKLKTAINLKFTEINLRDEMVSKKDSAHQSWNKINLWSQDSSPSYP